MKIENCVFPTDSPLSEGGPVNPGSYSKCPVCCPKPEHATPPSSPDPLPPVQPPFKFRPRPPQAPFRPRLPRHWHLRPPSAPGSPSNLRNLKLTSSLAVTGNLTATWHRAQPEPAPSRGQLRALLRASAVKAKPPTERDADGLGPPARGRWPRRCIEGTATAAAFQVARSVGFGQASLQHRRDLVMAATTGNVKRTSADAGLLA